jgi:hypothetical protein
MYKPITLIEKVCRWTLYAIMLTFTGLIITSEQLLSACPVLEPSKFHSGILKKSSGKS